MIAHALVATHLPLHPLAAGSMWVDMFRLTLPIAEKMLRPLFVYLFLILGLRIAGKRELAQLNPFDLVVLLMLSNTVQNSIIGEDNTVIGGFIGAATLLLLNSAVVRLVRRSRRVQKWVEGRPDVLVRDGKVLTDHLNRELITRAELLAAAHKQGIASLRDVDRCVLEPTGTISFIAKTPTEEGRRYDQMMELMQKVLCEVNALKEAKAVQNGVAEAG